MENGVETGSSPEEGVVEIRLLGPLTVSCGGVALALPASRKARALLGILALAPRPVPRSRLCELLWDVPDDPRGELRWCLSRIRNVLGTRRIEAQGDAVRLDLAGCRVDAAEVDQALRAGPGTLPTERLRALAALFAGDFLEGLELGRLPEFEGWLVAQRRHFRDGRAALLEALAGRLPEEEAPDILDAWLRLAPFDLRPHGAVLDALARRGRLREGEEHLAAASRLFEAEGLDVAPLRGLWRAARAAAADAPSVSIVPAAAAATPPAVGVEEGSAGPHRGSVAVMPFADLAEGPKSPGGGPADALVYDLIARLAKLRCLFVIGQGSVFALRDRGVAPAEAGRLLGVDYVVSGSVQRRGRRLSVAVELAEARSGRVVWAEVFDQEAEDTFLVLDGIGDRAVALIAGEIEAAERNRAVLRPPGSLDAWEAHHRGLWHMYRFNRADNDQARHFFEEAIRLDPTFSRAHAGLSFTHWQNAFQGWAERGAETERAYAAAAQGLMADERDPAAHWAMGRAFWLRGRHDPAVEELEHAVELSPNFALGHYSLAFVHSLTGDPGTAVAASEQSLRLSPHDPMVFGMLGARAMALGRLGRFEEAAEAGVRAAARPNAHAHILAIAAVSLSLAGRLEEARAHVSTIRASLPRYSVDDLVAAMQPTAEGERLFRLGAKRIGFG